MLGWLGIALLILGVLSCVAAVLVRASRKAKPLLRTEKANQKRSSTPLRRDRRMTDLMYVDTNAYSSSYMPRNLSGQKLEHAERKRERKHVKLWWFFRNILESHSNGFQVDVARSIVDYFREIDVRWRVIQKNLERVATASYRTGRLIKWLMCDLPPLKLLDVLNGKQHVTIESTQALTIMGHNRDSSGMPAYSGCTPLPDYFTTASQEKDRLRLICGEYNAVYRKRESSYLSWPRSGRAYDYERVQ